MSNVIQEVLIKISSLYLGNPVVESINYQELTETFAVTRQFSLTCVSGGAPASTVIWTKDCSVLPRDQYHVQSQVITGKGMSE